MANIKAQAILKGSRALLVVKKHSPELMTGLGIVGVVASGVFTVKATLKVQPVIEDMKTDVNTVKNVHDTGATTDKEFKKDLTKAYFKGSTKIAQLYWPSVTLGALSIGALIGGASISHKRVVGLAAAYKASEMTFHEYQDRVREELGEEKELELRTGLRAVEQEDEDGKKEVAMVFDPSFGTPSMYAKWFDEMNHNWSREANENLFFLRQVQESANHKLYTRGHLFLNEVYDMLGFERTGAGQFVGWVAGAGGKDRQVDFGLYQGRSTAQREFINGGNQPVVLLEFNVDGSIYDLIEDK